jgi:hypothetical protein
VPPTLPEACTPRASVFDPNIRDTVYNIDELTTIDPERFFAENYLTDGMRTLLSEAFKRLEGQSENAPGAILLSQSMGGGKTHSLIALGLLARNPRFRARVMAGFSPPGALGAVRVVTFSGRKTNTPFGIWGEVAEQLNRREAFRDFYQPLRPPGDADWIELLRGQPVLLLLDELPPYFEAARATTVGATTLDVITTTALANLLVATTSGRLPNVCVVLTDLRGTAYGAGGAAINQALENLQHEADRVVLRIDPVRLNTSEIYQILRTRLFEQLPDADGIAAVADAYAHAVDDARRMDLTTASGPQLRAEILSSYPFHPGIRDLYARFRENPGYQQTRALIRIMRAVVSRLWQSDLARRRTLIGAEDLDLHRQELLSEVRQINASLDNAIAHDVASDGGTSVAEVIDGPNGRDAQDAAKLIFLSSLSQAVNPTLGLSRAEVVALLAAPGRDLSLLNGAIDRLQAGAWYIHATSAGALLFKNVENLVAKQETYVQGMLREEQETELRQQLDTIFSPTLRTCYQLVHSLPALDQVSLTADRLALVIFRPADTALAEATEFFEHQQFKNRVIFLTGRANPYQQVLARAAALRAIRLILGELRSAHLREDEPQFQEALRIETDEQSRFYLACREAFQTLYYPTRDGLRAAELDPRYVAHTYEGEQQILVCLKDRYKFEEDTSTDGFRTRVENRLWPEGAREVLWSEVKRKAAQDPAWVFHHPRALDDLKDRCVQRDVWREGGGYVERGPFPQPPTAVTVRVQGRDDRTGETTLSIAPLHADQVYVSADGPATTASPRLESFTNYRTTAVRLSFLAVDSTGQHETGPAYPWTNQIAVKHRLYQDGDRRMCELQAVPSGKICFTVDGSSPATSGQPYQAPFAVPPDCRLILARASADGVHSEVLTVNLPRPPGPGSAGGPPPVPPVLVDPGRPATWKAPRRCDSTAETFQLLEQLVRHRAELAGYVLTTARGEHWVELRAAEELRMPAEKARAQADFLTDLIAGGSLSLDVDSLAFGRGQELLDLVAELRTELRPGEVRQ